MFTPCAIGFCKAGVARVLSTIKGTFAALASLEIPLRSRTSNFGFPSDSAKKRRVFSCTASVKFFGSSGSTKVVVIPNRGNKTFSILYDPPYRLLDATIWSPALSKTKMAVLNADVPDAVATAASPPSRAAMRCSNTSTVGLFKRV